MKHSLINYWLNDLQNNRFAGPARLQTQDEFSITPRADVVETDKEYTFYFDLPGIKKEDVQISLKGLELSVAGTRKNEIVQDTDGLKAKTQTIMHREERYFGKFERIFVLPETANTEAIGAEFKDGVLTISVAKKELSQPKVITIKSH